ncbi:hypothetical protein [Streptomyces sp. NPDC059788]|uniref:hypothetical protein n=1 Tax=Streptomyces sp. NPDC059788 TaxID=3346948 RepID=UPI00366582CF
MALTLTCATFAGPAGAAHAFTPGPHWNAVDDALKSHIAPKTLEMLWHADDASDKRPYWSDGQTHCDDFDHFAYQHEYRVRDFEDKQGNDRPDTSEELRASKDHYHAFQATRSARQASDLQLLGCLQYAFDRINLAVHLSKDLLDASGKQDPATRRDVRCREVPGQRYGGRHEKWGRYWLPSWHSEHQLWRDYYKTEPFFTDELKPNPKCNVIEQFGRGLHGIQDFYAHSNWADSEIRSDTPDLAYSKKIGTWANPKGLKHKTPFPLFDFARLGVRPVDYHAVQNAARRAQGAGVAPWRYLPPRLAYKKATGLPGASAGQPFYLTRFEQFRRQYLAAHHNRYPLSEAPYKDLQSGCYTEQTIIGNRICRETRQLGHYGYPSAARKNAKWALSSMAAGLAKDSLTGTTDRAAADLSTGKLPSSKADAEKKAANSSFTNAVAVATADTARQWTYFKARLAATYGTDRAQQMLRILTQDQTES